ncbi:hypothetical protein TIFTF001_021055 [Ficus carica]|uniref:Uncharacterized protein n=1 Tax=Ficus carica TaxID=3494 RepID=A0AA88DBI6_FICCA|nr:hypothetical protein TIFTF001_021055 [Ficus carica]
MLHTVQVVGLRESNIFNSNTQSTERKKGDRHRSSSWEKGKCTVNEGTEAKVTAVSRAAPGPELSTGRGGQTF